MYLPSTWWVRWQFLHTGWRLQPGGGASLAVAWLVGLTAGGGLGHRIKNGGDCKGKNCMYIYISPKNPLELIGPKLTYNWNKESGESAQNDLLWSNYSSTSHDRFSPNGGDCKGIPQKFHKNLGEGEIFLIWPDRCVYPPQMKLYIFIPGTQILPLFLSRSTPQKQGRFTPIKTRGRIIWVPGRSPQIPFRFRKYLEDHPT